VFGELHDAFEHGVDEEIMVFDVEVLGLGGHAVFNSVSSAPAYGAGCHPWWWGGTQFIGELRQSYLMPT
jgi:hypothetical protein